MTRIAPNSTILVLAPHTDDGEFGAGGSIARWIREGHEVHYVAFSACEESVDPEWPPDILTTEVRKATRALGIPESNLQLFDFPVRHFPDHRQQILEKTLELRSAVVPDIVLSPSLRDIHQDHQVVAIECLRAFKKSTVLAYEVPWNNIEFASNLFVHLELVDVEAKVAAIAQYASQASKPYSHPDYLEAQLRYRGTQIDVGFAETFEVVRWTM